jgi:hypothetical protein
MQFPFRNTLRAFYYLYCQFHFRFLSTSLVGVSVCPFLMTPFSRHSLRSLNRTDPAREESRSQITTLMRLQFKLETSRFNWHRIRFNTTIRELNLLNSTSLILLSQAGPPTERTGPGGGGRIKIIPVIGKTDTQLQSDFRLVSRGKIAPSTYNNAAEKDTNVRYIVGLPAPVRIAGPR